jgi:hypothetical protein
MEKFTAYDVLIGMLNHFPKGKNTFYADYCDIIDFLDEELKKYQVLNVFTRSQIEGGLSTLIGSRMLQWNIATPQRKQFRPREIDSAFVNFKKGELFGEKGLREVRCLSERFAEVFA